MNNTLPITERPLTNSQLLRLARGDHPIPLTDDLVQSVDHVLITMQVGSTRMVVPVHFGAGMALAQILVQEHTLEPTCFVSHLHRDDGEWTLVVDGTFKLQQ